MEKVGSAVAGNPTLLHDQLGGGGRVSLAGSARPAGAADAVTTVRRPAAVFGVVWFTPG
ncbi:hypothetical protein [Jiangella aurantiaca]|uniref:hypothetical protein n=1 Tax=Jiangella aurantiaca TaxID=2530373 RepID=UPI0013A5CEF7|nr:hypothetical protein [Jiangella aurantiaca]